MAFPKTIHLTARNYGKEVAWSTRHMPEKLLDRMRAIQESSGTEREAQVSLEAIFVRALEAGLPTVEREMLSSDWKQRARARAKEAMRRFARAGVEGGSE